MTPNNIGNIGTIGGQSARDNIEDVTEMRFVPISTIMEITFLLLHPNGDVVGQLVIIVHKIECTVVFVVNKLAGDPRRNILFA